MAFIASFSLAGRNGRTTYGSTGNDTMVVLGTDSIDGLGGNDWIYAIRTPASGNDGNDTLLGSMDNDRLAGGNGNDSIYASFGNDTVLGEAGNDRLNGSFGNDVVDGGDGDDWVYGDVGNDLLLGGAGNDTLENGTGNDTMYGGAGNDIFRPSTCGMTTIGDFDSAGITSAEHDLIDLTVLTRNALHWSATTPSAGGVWYAWSAGNTLVYVDTNHDGVADKQILLLGEHKLSNTDFIGLANSAPNAGDFVLPDAAKEDRVIELHGAPGAMFAHASDADAGAVLRISNPGEYVGQYGKLILNADGSYSYLLNNADPAVQALGGSDVVYDRFVYTISDGAASSSAHVVVEVHGTSDVRAADDSASTDEDHSVSINVLNNDHDPDGAPLTVQSAGNGAHGQVSIRADGQLEYTPDANWHGQDSFSYTVSNASGDSATATVTVDVRSVNDAPEGAPAAHLADGAKNVVYTVAAADLLSGFFDVDGDSLQVANLAADRGTLVDNGDGTWSFTPPVNYAGRVQLSYSVEDGAGGTLAAVQSFNLLDSGITVPSVFEFQINTETRGDQWASDLATLRDGTTVTVWSTRDPDSGAIEIHAQRYAADGKPLAGEIRLDTASADDYGTPSVSALADGGYVVTWSGPTPAGDPSGSGWPCVAVQRFTADGQPVGSPSAITSTVVNPTDADVVGLSDGGYVVSVTKLAGNGAPYVELERFDASGHLVGQTTPGNGEEASVAALPDGGFLVTWAGGHNGVAAYDILLQRYDALGAPVGGVVQVNTTSAGYQIYPEIATAADGSYAVTWFGETGSSMNSAAVYLQCFDAHGNAQGGEQVVASHPGSLQIYPSLCALEGGGYALTWVDDGLYGASGTVGIHFGRYAADGSSLGSESVITASTDDWYSMPHLTALPDGGCLVSWGAASGDGSEGAVYGMRYDAAGGAVSYTLEGHAGNDNLVWTGSDDVVLSGLGGDDVVTGGAGKDNLAGGDGNDTLRGGLGDDTLTGGLGADTFHWYLADSKAHYESGVRIFGSDQITDFNAGQGDKLDLRDLLQGEHHTGDSDIGNLLSYLHFEKVGDSTVVHVSSTAGFAGGYNSQAEDQSIVLQHVDLVSGIGSDQQIVQEMLRQGTLRVD